MKRKLQLTLFSLLLGCIHGFSQSNIVITEIMYNLPGSDTLEFIELYNKGTAPVNLKGYTFTQGVSYTFPNFTLDAGKYTVITRDSVYFAKALKKGTPFQWVSGNLDNNGEKIVLKDPSGNIADSVEYETGNTWSSQANGTGQSLILCDPSKNNAVGYNWSASQDFAALVSGTGVIYASPFLGNGTCTAPGEIFPPRIKKSNAKDLNTIRLKFDEPLDKASAENTSNYTGLGTIASATLNGTDSVTLVLSTPLVLGKIDSLTVTNVADTSNNAMPADKEIIVFNNTIADLVITEIMYDNNGPDSLEFVEVYNRGSSPANVGGYEFSNGIDFRFPSEMTINAGQYVAIPAYKKPFNAFFSQSVPFDYKGNLDNVGEKLAIKNTTGNIIDSLTYSPSWNSATNPGASLVLCNVSSDNHLGSSWGASGDSKGLWMGMEVWASPGAAGSTCILRLIPKSEKATFLVYPNPARQSFSIRFPDEKDREIRIFDAYGKLIFYSQTSDDSLMPSLPDHKGICFIEVMNMENNIRESSKIILE